MRAAKYVKQRLTDLKEEMDSNTIILGSLKVPLQQWVYNRGKNNKEMLELNDTLAQRDLTSIKEHSICSRMHTVFKYTWNILQDRSIVKPKTKS